jgi:hypothetical protein
MQDNRGKLGNYSLTALTKHAGQIFKRIMHKKTAAQKNNHLNYRKTSINSAMNYDSL